MYYVWSSDIIKKQSSMDQPGKVANPARGQLNRENDSSPVPVRASEFIWSRETGTGAVPSCVSLLTLHTQAESGAYSPDSSRFSRPRPFIHLTAMRHYCGPVPSLSGYPIAHRWRSLPRVRRHRASSPQGSSSNGCCLFAHHHGPINVRLSFQDKLLL